MPPISLKYKGPNEIRISDHAVVVCTVDEDGNLVPLPASGGGGGGGGDATAANQDTQIDQLSSILGSHGSVFVRAEGTTVTKTGNFIAVIGHEDFGIEDITLTGVSEGDSAIATGTSYQAGTQIIVPFTEITVSDFSGLVQLVKAPSV